MNKLLVPLLLACAAAGCTDGPQPVAARTATDGVSHRTLQPVTPDIGRYWRTPDTVTIYDQRPELGIAATRDDFAVAAAGGMRLIRYTVYWGDPNGPTDLSNALNDATASGSELEVVVHNSSQCRPLAGDPYLPYATYVSTLVASYPQVRFWELFNEEDAPGATDMFGGSGPAPCDTSANVNTYQQGYNYAQMMKIAYPMVKAANPKAWVLMGGLSTSNTDFLNGFYDGGGKRYYDFLNVHAYGQSADGPDPFNRGDVLRNAAAAKGDPGRPVWLTEFGHGGANDPAGTYSATQLDTLQRHFWKKFMDNDVTMHTYVKMIGYHLHTTDPSYWPKFVLGGPFGYTTADYGAGILYMNGTARPTYTYVQQSGYNSPVFASQTRSVTVEIISADMVPADYTYDIVSDNHLRIYNVPLNFRAPTNIRFVEGNTTAPPTCTRTSCVLQ